MDPMLQTLRQEIGSAIAGLAATQLAVHPPGKWSTAEVIEHLYLTYTGTTKGFQRVEAAGHSLATHATLRHRAGVLLVVGFGYLPSGRQAPPVARPRGLPVDKVVPEIGAKIEEMDEIMNRCETLLGARSKVLDHPLLGPLTVAEWRKFHLVHGRHHLKQIQRLRRLRA